MIEMDDTSDEPPPPVAGKFPAASTSTRSLENTVNDHPFVRGHSDAVKHETRAIYSMTGRAPVRKHETSEMQNPQYEQLVERTHKWDRKSTALWIAVTAGVSAYKIAEYSGVLERIEPVYAAFANGLSF